jgi:hypothetical protein
MVVVALRYWHRLTKADYCSIQPSSVVVEVEASCEQLLPPGHLTLEYSEEMLGFPIQHSFSQTSAVVPRAGLNVQVRLESVEVLPLLRYLCQKLESRHRLDLVD